MGDIFYVQCSRTAMHYFNEICFASFTLYCFRFRLFTLKILQIAQLSKRVLLLSDMTTRTVHLIQLRKWFQILKVTLQTLPALAKLTRMEAKHLKWPKQITLNTPIQLITACPKNRLAKCHIFACLYVLAFFYFVSGYSVCGICRMSYISILHHLAKSSFLVWW